MKRKMSLFLVASLFCASLCPPQVFYAKLHKNALDLSSEKISENTQDTETENVENSGDQTANTDTNSSTESENQNISEKYNKPRVKFCFPNFSEISKKTEKSDSNHNFSKKTEKSNSKHAPNEICEKCEKPEKREKPEKCEKSEKHEKPIFKLPQRSVSTLHGLVPCNQNLAEKQKKLFSPSNQDKTVLPTCGPNAKFLNEERTLLSLGNDEIILSSQSVNAFPQLLFKPDLIENEFLYNQPMYFHSPITISGVSTSKLAKINFGWLTVCTRRPVVFENLEISGLIHTTSNSSVTFKNCKIHGSPRRQDEAVQILGGASVEFEDCIFDCNTPTCVRIKDNLNAIFKNCEFKCSNAGVLLEYNANIEAYNCNFFSNKKVAIMANHSPKILLRGCKFHDSEAVSILLQNVGGATVEGCKFNNLQRTAIIANKSGLKVGMCVFQNINMGIHATNCDNKIDILNCHFNNIKFNGIVFKFSSGKILGCSFSGSGGPAVLAYGKGSNPIIENCSISNVKSPCIAVTNDSSPIFSSTSIDHFDTEFPVIYCSDFSGSVFQNLKFVPQDTVPSVLASNAAKVKISSDSQFIPQCKLFGEMSLFGPTCEKLSPEFVNERNVNYDSEIDTNIKVISCQCGHPITKCPNCGNKDSDVFTFSGEQLICKNCGKLTFLPNDEHCCEICKRPICGVTLCRPVSTFGNSECMICCEKKANVIFLPCGHKCTCRDCAKEYSAQSDRCPFCNKPVKKFVYDFFSDKENCQ